MTSLSSTTFLLAKKDQKRMRKNQRNLKDQKKSRTNNSLNIFENLNKKNYDIKEITEKWFTLFCKNDKSALISLIQLILDASNSKCRLTEKIIAKNGIPKLMEIFGETLDEKPYLFSLTTKESKIFKFNLKRFMTTLIQNYKSELIFQSDFIKNLLIWLKPLSESSVRAFRHISVFCALTISSELCLIHSNLREILKSKPISKKRSRQSHLDQSFVEVEQNIDAVFDILSEIFDQIFAFRYLDVVSDIRTSCLMALGDWIRIDPMLFLKNQYLKYVGWMLNDRINGVRYKAVTIVYTMLNEVDFSKINYFISRFKTRILNMCFDVSDDVCVVALKIVLILLTKIINMPKDKLDSIIRLVYSDSFKIARTTSLVLIEHLRQNDSNLHFLEKLVAFSLENTSESNIPRSLIVSIFSQSELLRPIKFLPSMKEVLSSANDQNEAHIIQLIACYLTHFSNLKEKDKTDSEFVDNFVYSSVEKWLHQYRLEPTKIIHVIKICEFFNHPSQTNNEFTSHLLESIKTVILTTDNQEALEACASMLERLSDQILLKTSCVG